MLFRLDERVPMRCRVMGPKRRLLLRPERLLFPALLRRLLQVPEQIPFRGQELPQPYRGRWQGRTKPDVRS